MPRPRNDRPPGLNGQLGERVELLRKRRGWDVNQLADAAGLGHGTIIRIESGSVSPSLDTIVSVADALGISASELLRGCADWTRRVT